MNCRKILVAVDASENAVRAVTYTGEIVGATPGFQITVMSIERFPERDTFPSEAAWHERCQVLEKQLKQVLEDARTMLEGKGVPAAAIDTHYVASCRPDNANAAGGGVKCSPGRSIAQDILDKLREGGYGTVVVGRRGVSKAEQFLFGSVSNKIVNEAKNCTVWVVA